MKQDETYEGLPIETQQVDSLDPKVTPQQILSQDLSCINTKTVLEEARNEVGEPIFNEMIDQVNAIDQKGRTSKEIMNDAILIVLRSIGGRLPSGQVTAIVTSIIFLITFALANGKDNNKALAATQPPQPTYITMENGLSAPIYVSFNNDPASSLKPTNTATQTPTATPDSIPTNTLGQGLVFPQLINPNNLACPADQNGEIAQNAVDNPAHIDLVDDYLKKIKDAAGKSIVVRAQNFNGGGDYTYGNVTTYTDTLGDMSKYDLKEGDVFSYHFTFPFFIEKWNDLQKNSITDNIYFGEIITLTNELTKRLDDHNKFRIQPTDAAIQGDLLKAFKNNEKVKSGLELQSALAQSIVDHPDLLKRTSFEGTDISHMTWTEVENEIVKKASDAHLIIMMENMRDTGGYTEVQYVREFTNDKSHKQKITFKVVEDIGNAFANQRKAMCNPNDITPTAVG